MLSYRGAMSGVQMAADDRRESRVQVVLITGNRRRMGLQCDQTPPERELLTAAGLMLVTTAAIITPDHGHIH
jgi:hypothetical protein